MAGGAFWYLAVDESERVMSQDGGWGVGDSVENVTYELDGVEW